ncbi:hypothetical protein K1W54_23875 [Micromonospora sp. CPCC 205371]|nr:hypothetical protein [Micromonospora sp. CPCC 205371]
MTGNHRYPIPRPCDGDDHRFCLGLAIDISNILTRYGYPPITDADLIYWQQRLFTTICQEKQP